MKSAMGFVLGMDQWHRFAAAQTKGFVGLESVPGPGFPLDGNPFGQNPPIDP
jgi:hypothetical protein